MYKITDFSECSCSSLSVHPYLQETQNKESKATMFMLKMLETILSDMSHVISAIHANTGVSLSHRTGSLVIECVLYIQVT